MPAWPVVTCVTPGDADVAKISPAGFAEPLPLIRSVPNAFPTARPACMAR